MQSGDIPLQTIKMLMQNSLHLILNFAGIIISSSQGKTNCYNMYTFLHILCI